MNPASSMNPLDQRWSIAQSAGLATILEASAPKFGNVHPSASFADMHFGHFVASAAVQSSCFEKLDGCMGELVLRTIEETQLRVRRNTNLGTVLLLAPLAMAAVTARTTNVPSQPHSDAARLTTLVGQSLDPSTLSLSVLQAAVNETLQRLTANDCRLVYQAIRVANPGGLGKQADNDVTEANAPECLIAAMKQVANIDAVARQYVNGFSDLFETLLGWLDQELAVSNNPLLAIQQLQLRCLAWQPDGLVIRKLGFDQAVKIQNMATELLHLRELGDSRYETYQLQFDQYLRADGNRRNPGTTADLIAATLFVRLVCGA